MQKTAIILCGGKGTRLGAIGKKTPKSLVKVNGKEILWYIIKILKKNGFNHIILPLGYKGKQIKVFLKKNDNFKIKIKTFETGLNTNIGKRLAQVIDEVGSSYFLLLNGDAIFDFNINNLIDNHLRSKASVTFMSTEMTYQYGTVGVINDKVVDFKRNLFFEKLKVRGKGNYIAYNYSGISIINTKDLKKLKKICGKSKNFEMEIYPRLIKKKAIMKSIKGFWYSIDNLKDIKFLKKDRNKISIIKKIKARI